MRPRTPYLFFYTCLTPDDFTRQLADLTMSKRSGTSNKIEIQFAVFNRLDLCVFFMKLTETL